MTALTRHPECLPIYDVHDDGEVIGSVIPTARRWVAVASYPVPRVVFSFPTRERATERVREIVRGER